MAGSMSVRRLPMTWLMIARVRRGGIMPTTASRAVRSSMTSNCKRKGRTKGMTFWRADFRGGAAT